MPHDENCNLFRYAAVRRDAVVKRKIKGYNKKVWNTEEDELKSS